MTVPNIPNIRSYTNIRMTLWGNAFWSYTGVGLLLLFSNLSCHKEQPQKEEPEAGASKPPEAVLPDLSGCTRAQIRLYPSALRWYGIRPGEEEGLLSQGELKLFVNINERSGKMQ